MHPSAMDSSGPGPSGIDVEALLDEGAWVRALAQRLVGAGDADDVAQDTLIAALEHAPRDPLHRRSWLARVTTNFARLKHRGDAHRTQREMRASHPEAQPSASETLERLEAQRALVDALRALDEPYRTTVMRRYFDNESAADIARTENVPAATVRWRLMRGVEELRAKLDQRYGDRASWSVAFIPLIRHHAALPAAAVGTSAATITGVLVMNALSRTALVAALVVSGSLGIWLAVRTESPLDLPDIAHRSAPDELEKPETNSTPTTELAAPKAPTEARAAVPATSMPVAAAQLARTTGHVDGRFVDASGRAIADVTLVEPVFADHATVKSDEHGAFVLDIPLAPAKGTMKFEARCAGWATFYGNIAPRPDETQRMGDIVLEPGGSIAGVVLGPDGAPAAGVQVMATDPQFTDLDSERRQGPGEVRVPNTTSAVDGSFRIDGVPARMMRAWAHVDGTRWAFSDPIDVPAVGVRAGIVLNLEALSADDRIEGIVLDPAGKPLAGVYVNFACTSAGHSWSSSIQTHADGRFQILVMRKVKHDLSVRDGKGEWSAVALDGVEPGTLDVVLKFHEPRRLDLVVTDEKGAPLEEFRAKLTKPNGYEEHWNSMQKQHRDGRFSIPIPDSAFVVVAWSHGHAEMKSIMYEPTAAPARVDMVLRTLPGVRGHVLADGKPVSGARLELHDVGGAWAGMRMEKDGWLTRINPNVMEHETSDDAGAFDITVRKSGKYVVVCEAPGFARALSATIDVDPKVGVSGLEMNLGRGGAIEGHVLVPNGRDPGGIIVGITRYDLAPRTQRTGSDGAFRFEGLTPGDWSVRRVAAEIDPGIHGTNFSTAKGEIQYPTDCTVDDGKATRFDLDLRHAFDVVLVGHVSVNGAPAAGWSVNLWPDATFAHSGALPGGTVDESGTVRIVMPHPGKVRIQLLPHVEGASVKFDQEMELTPGENPWIVDVLTGSLEGKSASGAGTALSYEWKESGPLLCTARFMVDADGRFRLAVVPIGAAQMNVESGGKFVDTRMVEVKQGETAVVDLP